MDRFGWTVEDWLNFSCSGESELGIDEDTTDSELDAKAAQLLKEAEAAGIDTLRYEEIRATLEQVRKNYLLLYGEA